MYRSTMKLLPVAATLALVAGSPAAQSAPKAAAALESELVAATVYPGFATLERRAKFPEGGGPIVLGGLPFAAQPDSVRVDAVGGEIVSVEVRDRMLEVVPSERLQAVRAQIAELEGQLGVLADERALMTTLRESVQGMLIHTRTQGQRDVERGHPDPEAWRASLNFVRAELSTLDADSRALIERRRAIERQIGDLRLEAGSFEQRGGVAQREIHLDVVDLGAAGGELVVRYLVGDAGWEPVYDLRAAADLTAVDLVYRAKVWQRSGEDWNDAQVTLSTAQPQRGARGPQPFATWLGLQVPGGRVHALETMRGLGYVGDGDASSMELGARLTKPAAPTNATVLNDGPVVRFELPRRETIESRKDATQVLVGRARLEIDVEHVCTPALDPTVWLRGRAKNTSPYAMLRGRASVYLGTSFLGHADFDPVRPGEEFTLHLGADDGFSVERTQLAREAGSSGVFQKRSVTTEHWRVVATNHGGRGREGEKVTLIVHELVPKSAHEDVEVEIDAVRPKFAKSERWAKLEQETGARTWVVSLGRGQQAVLEIETVVRHPQGTRLTRR